MLGLEGKVAVVTGGSQGIGRSCARRLAAAGARVVVVARREALVDETVAELRHDGADAVGVAGDVRDAATVARMVDVATSTYGCVDVLVNNAGASYAETFRRAPLAELDLDDLRGAVELNVATAFACSRACAEVMPAGSSIVTIGSIVATHPFPGFGFYSAAKAAVVSLTRLMALEWAPRIRANAVLAGHIDTERASASRTPEAVQRLVGTIALQRLGTPDDVAGAVVYLASDLAAWTTAAALAVDGGHLAL